MRGQAGFFDVEERLKELSAKGDALERLNAVVDFDLFRGDLEQAVARSDGSKGGRPAFDHVLMFKVLVLQATHGLSDERTEYLIRGPGGPAVQLRSQRRAHPAQKTR